MREIRNLSVKMLTLNFSTAVPVFNLSINASKANSLCFEDASVVRALAYVIILLVSLAGNSMTIAVVFRGRLHMKNVHLFLLNMAIADLVVTVVYMPRMVVMMLYGNSWLVTGTFGLILCRTVPFLHHMSILVSVFTILGATLDRFFAMVFPLRKIMTSCVGKTIVVCIWLVAGILRLPYAISAVLKNNGYYFSCSGNLKRIFGKHTELYHSVLLAIYCTLLVTTIVLYSVTILKLKGNDPPVLCNDAARAKRAQASKKLLNMLIVILVCFILCWFMYFFALSILPRPLSCETMFFRFFLAHSNSALNPCILAVFDFRYRRGYKTILNKIAPCFKVIEYTDSVPEASVSTIKTRTNCRLANSRV
ncbi:neuropeptide SIFamide receptor-like [Actinia tenebrosa]|uniref:Neuropeptide SIFamide receptor-like n=1 Tax=Actinia tenebrosa TaxID=6105 RepID=A0A6P8IUX2_ACTTE|nr:neuropeptide SIFamide receptor-like [Actinia tenebrosa]